MTFSTHEGGKNHLRMLDGLRGLLAVWVWIGHCCVKAAISIPGFEDTRSAVQLFMILSGFVMSWNHFQNGRVGSGELRDFYIKRFFRLSPLYYALLMITGAAYLTAHFSYGFGLVPALANSTPLPDWSLSLEMQFYLTFPLLVLVSRRIGEPALLILSILLMYAAERVISVPEAPAHFPLLTYPVPSILPLSLPLFISGMVIARALQRAAGIAAWMVCGAAIAFHHGLIVLVITTLTVLALYDHRGVAAYSKLLTSHVSGFLGRKSYSVYLIHLPVITLVAPKFVALPAYERFLALLLIPAPVILGLSTVAYYVIERPGIKLGNFLIGQPWRSTPSPQLPVSQ